MPKNITKFNVALQKEFPFLKVVAESESDAFCGLCNSKFSVADGGRTRINHHISSQKHIKAAKTVKSNQPMSAFLATNPAQIQLQGKELAFAYHSAKHRSSTRTADCTSKLINNLFETKFTCGATKCSKLVQKVDIKLGFIA
jgi:hypothetical protein